MPDPAEGSLGVAVATKPESKSWDFLKKTGSVAKRAGRSVGRGAEAYGNFTDKITGAAMNTSVTAAEAYGNMTEKITGGVMDGTVKVGKALKENVLPTGSTPITFGEVFNPYKGADKRPTAKTSKSTDHTPAIDRLSGKPTSVGEPGLFNRVINTSGYDVSGKPKLDLTPEAAAAVLPKPEWKKEQESRLAVVTRLEKAYKAANGNFNPDQLKKLVDQGIITDKEGAMLTNFDKTLTDYKASGGKAIDVDLIRRESSARQQELYKRTDVLYRHAKTPEGTIEEQQRVKNETEWRNNSKASEVKEKVKEKTKKVGLLMGRSVLEAAAAGIASVGLGEIARKMGKTMIGAEKAAAVAGAVGAVTGVALETGNSLGERRQKRKAAREQRKTALIQAKEIEIQQKVLAGEDETTLRAAAETTATKETAESNKIVADLLDIMKSPEDRRKILARGGETMIAAAVGSYLFLKFGPDIFAQAQSHLTPELLAKMGGAGEMLTSFLNLKTPEQSTIPTAPNTPVSETTASTPESTATASVVNRVVEAASPTVNKVREKASAWATFVKQKEVPAEISKLGSWFKSIITEAANEETT